MRKRKKLYKHLVDTHGFDPEGEIKGRGVRLDDLRAVHDYDHAFDIPDHKGDHTFDIPDHKGDRMTDITTTDG